MFFEAEAPPCPVVLEAGLLSACDIQQLSSLIIQSPESLSPSSGSQGSSRAVYNSADDRKLRRMVSNRESARRSRWRKKRHLENLSDELKRLKSENKEAENRLHLLLHRCLSLHSENKILKSESFSLAAKLSHLCWLLGSNSHAHATCPIFSDQYSYY